MILKKILDFFEKYNVSLSGKRVCVCFSGGADSVALLMAMNKLKGNDDFSLSAVHVNHHIRGDEADGDQRFCRDVCHRLGLDFYSYDVYALIEAEKRGMGVEATARKLRYDSFEKLRAEQNIDYFLTAHHGNDTAETIVFNMLRGSSVSGLVGIPPVRDFYLRPLIQCSKNEILEYLSSLGEGFVEDSTNSDEAYTRNYIRRTLFPSFERVNPNFLTAILRLSGSAAQDEDYFSKELDKITSETDLASLHPSVSSRYVCAEYEKLSDGEGLSAVHVRQILSCLSSSEEKSIDVPFGIKALVKNGRVAFFKKKEVALNNKVMLTLGNNFLGDDVCVRLEEKYERIKRFSDFPLKIVLPRNKINGELYVRRREDGDRIVCRGFGRNVNRELMNAKVPKYMRDSVPIICDGEGILFVPFVGADDRAFQKGFIDDPLMITVDIDFKEMKGKN